MRSEKSFRKVAFGFHPQDVVEYLSEITRQHGEETEAMRMGAEKLRQELERVMAELAQKEAAAANEDEVADALNALMEERDQNARDLEQERAENRRLCSEIELSRNELREQLERTARGATETDALLATIAELSAEKEQWKSRASASRSEQEAGETALRAELETIRADYAGAKERCDILETDCAAARASRAQLQERCNSLEADCTAMKAERASLQASLDELQTEKDEWNTERESIREALETFLSERKAFEEAKSAFEEERKAFLDEMAQATRDNLALSAEREDLNRRHAELLRREDEVEAKRSTCEVLQNSLTAENEALRVRVESLQTECDTLRDRLREADASENRLRESKERAGRILEEAGAEAARLRREAEALTSETRQVFQDVITNGKATSLNIVLELDKMRAFFARFGDHFSEQEAMLRSMEGSAKRRVRAFTPGAFEE